MIKWTSLDMNDIIIKSKNIVKLLNLPLINDILFSMSHGVKKKTNRNNVLSRVPILEQDRVLGFLIKSPGLMTRRYI